MLGSVVSARISLPSRNPQGTKVLNAAVVVNRSTDVGQRKTPPDQIADKQPERTELAKCRQKLRRHRPRPVFLAAPHGARTLRQTIPADRQRVVAGKGVSVRGEPGGARTN